MRKSGTAAIIPESKRKFRFHDVFENSGIMAAVPDIPRCPYRDLGFTYYLPLGNPQLEAIFQP
jgi:hypothetical protein